MPCPVKPKPLQSKASLFSIFFKKQHSWLDGLYERSYSMKMGQVNMPGLDLYMVNQLDLVRRVLIDDVEHFPKHEMLHDIMGPLLGESIFTTNGPQWRRQRNLLDPVFDLHRVQHVFSLMRAASQAMEARLNAVEHGSEIDVDSEMTFVTADIIFRTILSVSLDSSEARKILDAFVIFQQESPKIALRRMFRLPHWLVWRRSARRWRHAGEQIRAALAKVIRPRYDAFHAGGADALPGDDILDAILATVREDTGQGFSFEEILDQVAMLFLAGHETSASALTWSLYLLALHPEIQERAGADVERVLGDAEPELGALKQLSFVRDIFREALRLYPPVGFLARECTHATQMRDKRLAAGSTIVISPWLIHRHREYWVNPDDFDPERFTREKPLRDAFLPFGTGPRVCIGVTFAMQEAVLILACLLRRYRFVLVPGFTPKPVGRLTIRSENGMLLKLEHRER